VKKRPKRTAEEIARHERTQQRLLERIAYHERKLAEERAAKEQQQPG
jgi:hypothetical protein